MAGTSREISSAMDENHDNFDLFKDEDVFEGTPPNEAEIAKNAFNDLLPTKLKERYELAYAKFNNFKKQIRTTSSSENILMAYFTELKKK